MEYIWGSLASKIATKDFKQFILAGLNVLFEVLKVFQNSTYEKCGF